MSVNTTTGFKAEVSFLQWGTLNTMVDWCRNNCEGEWGISESDTGYIFYFDIERDYVQFWFRWQK